MRKRLAAFAGTVWRIVRRLSFRVKLGLKRLSHSCQPGTPDVSSYFMEAKEYVGPTGDRRIEKRILWRHVCRVCGKEWFTS